MINLISKRIVNIKGKYIKISYDLIEQLIQNHTITVRTLSISLITNQIVILESVSAWC
jgi:hypothetical protein